jgi:hypothetical protein
MADPEELIKAAFRIADYKVFQPLVRIEPKAGPDKERISHSAIMSGLPKPIS